MSTSIEDLTKECLYQCSMWPQDIDTVMAAVKVDPVNKCMEDRWQDDTNDYPPQLMAVIWHSAKQHALAWIDANCPEAWYRLMFLDVDAKTA